MITNKKLALLAVLLAVLSADLKAAQGGGAAKGPPPALAQTKVMVLNTYGIWRFSCTLEPPVLASGESVQLKYAWLRYKTAAPAPDWMKPGFDDGSWDRGPITLACKSPMLAKVCLRGKFTVTDPAAVRGLALSARYHGGLIVYVNGQEVHREHVAPGQTLAEGPAGVDCNVTDLAVAPELLKKGVNVIGLEVVRAPYAALPEKMFEQYSCQILNVKLTCDNPSGLIPDAVRPEGLQVWNADPLAVDLDVDFGDQAEGLRPIVITGARNGAFTGKIVAGSTKPIRELKVTPAGLGGPGGTIPAANVRVRYGVPWGDYHQVMVTNTRRPFAPYPTGAQRLGALAEKPLAEFPVLPLSRETYGALIRPDATEVKPVMGAVVPLWITIKVPPNVPAGKYTGSVKVEDAM